ncbi:solute carrier family 35 member F1 [Pyricularia oryzae Y34]|uniref:Solute carrier family 35 member F1 n=3 Tax=Pyricularia oryzae TaxID=318829 RepID=Q2KEX5_PYRO7|nr:hypothetical protein MGCH7_ch7g911 [Pyricularia oryzae 70-15]ELQ44512.1 solute carrier family 35 member F1 [Pyricularia oryzae Y34]
MGSHGTDNVGTKAVGTTDVQNTATHDSADMGNNAHTDAVVGQALHQIEARKVHWYSYLTTIDFWIVLALGQVLALCITGTNTLSQLLSNAGTSIPAFQTIFNYVLLTLIYLSYTLYEYGPRKLGRIWLRDGWKYFILSFLDVEGNYFTVLAYRYTNLLSAQLINFWAIVVVVLLSFFFLKVRYRPFQVVGILVCCGGMGLLIGSDHLAGSNGGPGEDMLKGDLFALVGSTCYGLSNVFEEWLVSRRPVYEVLSFLGVFGVVINGVQAAIFDREQFATATWSPAVGGYLAGYTLVLTIFYSLVPFVLRMASAAFYNISLLTGSFWGVIIGIHVFGYVISQLYPVAFVLIILGLLVYFLSGSMLGESKKPWLGDNQEEGHAGFGTAKLKALNLARKQGLTGTAADDSRFGIYALLGAGMPLRGAVIRIRDVTTLVYLPCRRAGSDPSLGHLTDPKTSRKARHHGNGAKNAMSPEWDLYNAAATLENRGAESRGALKNRPKRIAVFPDVLGRVSSVVRGSKFVRGLGVDMVLEWNGTRQDYSRLAVEVLASSAAGRTSRESPLPESGARSTLRTSGAGRQHHDIQQNWNTK